MVTQTKDTPRSFPYFWPTWLVGLLSADDHCRYAAWYKGHHKYAKVAQDAEDEARLRQYNAAHEEMLQQEAARLKGEGYDVHIETPFTVNGDRAALGGKIDLVAVKGDEGEVIDIKTGRQYAKHRWQVLLYMAFGIERIAALKHLAGTLRGRVMYRGTNEVIAPDEAPQARQAIARLVTDLAASTPPPAAPSPRGCQYCDILLCEFRYQDKPVEAPAPGF